MECLDANVVQALMGGVLSSDARAGVVAHLDTCDECRQLLAVTARDHKKSFASEATLGDSQDMALDATRLPNESEGAVMRARSQPGAGVRFGRYELLERLGAGAMGVVWRAIDPELGRHVALKLLKQPDPLLTERLVREARAMAQVNHPNVVAVYDVGVADGQTYIAMELVAGKSLRAWQRAERRKVPEIIEAYGAAGRGLAAAHAAGLVHRDFKPDNVLVGDDGRVRVTDFGLAAGTGVAPATSEREVEDLALTREGTVLGTPAYMAPEQFTGGNVDSRTDQFNFSVALYEALYGVRPFDGKTYAELADNVLEGRVRPPPANSQVSGGLGAIVMRGLAVKPGDRYPTIDHLIAELGRDRAKPWRVAAIVAASIAALLGLGFGADWIVRERALAQIRQSFATYGTAIEKAGQRQAQQFRNASGLLDQLPVIEELTSSHAEADFGLTSPEQDAKRLQEVRDQLVSQSWTLVRELGGAAHPSQIAVADATGRLMYSSAAPDEWQGDLLAMPAVQRAMNGGKAQVVVAVRYDEPGFAAAHVFGATPPHGLALMFARAFDRNGQLGGVFIQFVDGNDVLEGIRLDQTELGLIGEDGTTVGDVPPALARAVPTSGKIAEVSSGDDTLMLQARPIADFAGQPIARVVIGRPLPGVLSLFPHARAVLALAALAALALAIGMFSRARKIAGARV
jgi:serine/threonine protein kinase